MYASVAPSASTLEKQNASTFADPAVADEATTRWPLQAPEEATDNCANPSRALPRLSVTRTMRGPATAAGLGGHGVTDETVIDVPGGPEAGVLVKSGSVTAVAPPVAHTVNRAITLSNMERTSSLRMAPRIRSVSQPLTLSKTFTDRKN
jgi:hypothetical protein